MREVGLAPDVAQVKRRGHDARRAIVRPLPPALKSRLPVLDRSAPVAAAA
jgi:hypothetical protein